jgi:hypothetical protein
MYEYMEGSSCDVIEVLSWLVYGETEKNHKEFSHHISQLRFESSTC